VVRFILNSRARVLQRKRHHVDDSCRLLIKNLFLGYLSSTTSDKSSILRVFANVLDFTEPEKHKTGLNSLMAQSNRPSRRNSLASLKVENSFINDDAPGAWINSN